MTIFWMSNCRRHVCSLLCSYSIVAQHSFAWKGRKMPNLKLLLLCKKGKPQ
jgi:hypothetical protein